MKTRNMTAKPIAMASTKKQTTGYLFLPSRKAAKPAQHLGARTLPYAHPAFSLLHPNRRLLRVLIRDGSWMFGNPACAADEDWPEARGEAIIVHADPFWRRRPFKSRYSGMLPQLAVATSCCRLAPHRYIMEFIDLGAVLHH